MNDDNYINELSTEIPKELHEKYSKEIDNLISESRIQINNETYCFTPKKKSYLIPFIINIIAALIIISSLLLITSYFNKQEHKIISNYTVLNSVEGKILYEYKQQTEEKLKKINNEIDNIEKRLLNVTDEKNNLLAEIDARVIEKQTQLEKQMQQKLEEERKNLQEQGLSAEAIEKKLEALEQTQQNEISEYKKRLRSELEKEYNIKQEDYLALVEEYEETLKQVQVQRKNLENELEKSDIEIKNLAKHIERTESLVEENNTFNENQQEEALVIELISSMYNETKLNIESSEFEKAIENLNTLSKYLNEKYITLLPAIQKRKEIDEFIIRSLKKLIELETIPENTEHKPELTKTVIDSPIKTNMEIPKERLKLLELLNRLKFIEDEFNSFFIRNSNIFSSISEQELINQLEVKLLVKEILNSNPIASEYPGLSSKLEEYYSALATEKIASGKLYALLDVLDLLENIESNSPRIRHNWGDINNEEIKNIFNQIIQKLQSILK